MRKEFLVNLVFLVLINLLIKPLYIFGIDVGVQNAVGPADYGLYFTLLNFTYLFQIINDFGIQIYNNRLIASHPEKLPALFPKLATFKLVLSVVFIGLVLIWALILGYQDYLQILSVIIVNQVFLSLILYLRSNISGLGKYRFDSLISVSDKFLMILLCGWFLWVDRTPFTISLFVYLQSVSLLLTLMLCLLILGRTNPLKVKMPSSRLIKSMIRETWPYAMAVFLMTLYTRIDAVMIERLLESGKTESGIYAAAYRIFDAFNMVAYLFAVLLLPMFSKLLYQVQKLRRLLSLSFRLMVVLTMVVSLNGFVFREEIMSLLYAEANPYWGEVFGYLILSFLAVGMMYIFGTLLTTTGKMARLNTLYGSCVLINVVLNLILIPRYFASGAALATLITQSFATLVLVLLGITHVQYPLTVNKLLALSGYLLSGLMISLSADWLLPIPWYYALSIAILFTVVLSIPFKLFRISEIRAFLLSGNSLQDVK